MDGSLGGVGSVFTDQVSKDKTTWLYDTWSFSFKRFKRWEKVVFFAAKNQLGNVQWYLLLANIGKNMTNILHMLS